MTKGTKSTTFKQQEMLKTSTKLSVGDVLSEVLTSARDDGRLTCGLYQSGLVLEMAPGSVMVCVLPDNKADDVTLDIHYTLIEAFCLENEVRIIKVDSSEKLQQLLGERGKRTEKNKTTTASAGISDSVLSLPDLDDDNYFYNDGAEWQADPDYNCVLVEYPAAECSEREEDLLEYHKHTCAELPQPVVELNV